MKKALLTLRNAICSDYSIRRYTLGWSDVVNMIGKKYPNEPVDDKTYFQDSVVREAIEASSGKMRETIECFARELNMNIETFSAR